MQLQSVMNRVNNVQELEFSQKHLLSMYSTWYLNSSKQYQRRSESFKSFNKIERRPMWALFCLFHS